MVFLLHCVAVFLCVRFFFFKQKTAYEMRISDWSSDVCSSDLSLFRARSGSFEPAVAFAGRQGPQQDQQEGRSAPDVWMFPDFLESVASSACAKRIHK